MIVEKAMIFRTMVRALAILSIIVLVAHGFATDSSSRPDALVTRVDDYLARSLANGFAGAALLAGNVDGVTIRERAWPL